jgi:hypothetical protein
MYDPAIAGERERKLALVWIRRTLPLIRTALVKADSALDALLVKFQPSDNRRADDRSSVEIDGQATRRLSGGAR